MATLNATIRTFVTIQSGVIRAVQDHCHGQLPREGCGILAGIGREITRFFPIPNQDHSCRSFSFEPRAYLDTLKEIRRLRLDWLGILHSHPSTEPYPSSRDVSQWHYPEVISWILSFKGQSRLSAFFIQDGTITPVMYQVVPDRDIERSRLE